MIRKKTIEEVIIDNQLEVERQPCVFYNHNIEVDFYIPDEALAIQVSYAPHKTEETWQRESSALIKLSRKLDCRRLLIISYEEEAFITVGDNVIEIIPIWKWLIQNAI